MNVLTTPATVAGRIVKFVLVFAFVGVISSCAITIGIWPGQVKLLAPLFCTDAQPDAFVVADTYSPQPGETVTNFSLYCMGPRGDATDHGFMKPFLLISVLNGAVIMLILGTLMWMGRSALREQKEFIDQFAPDADPFDLEPRPDDPPDEPTATPATRPGGDHTPTRSAPPPGSTPGPFVD